MAVFSKYVINREQLQGAARRGFLQVVMVNYLHLNSAVIVFTVQTFAWSKPTNNFDEGLRYFVGLYHYKDKFGQV